MTAIGQLQAFNNGQELSAWLRITPLNKSSGDQERLERSISKMSDQYIRHLLVLGITSRMRMIKTKPEMFDPWFTNTLMRQPSKLAIITMANKTACMIWALLVRNESYKVSTV